jgi:hypothetical protein
MNRATDVCCQKRGGRAANNLPNQTGETEQELILHSTGYRHLADKGKARDYAASR